MVTGAHLLRANKQIHHETEDLIFKYKTFELALYAAPVDDLPHLSGVVKYRAIARFWTAYPAFELPYIQ
jgi:hypothetical protein